MRLIDADKLFDWGKYKLSDAVKHGNKDTEQRSFSYSTLMMYEIAHEIEYAPTVELKQQEDSAIAAIRKSLKSTGNNRPYLSRCSRCVKFTIDNTKRKYKYGCKSLCLIG